MAKAYKHWAVKKSWWHGTVTTACGLVFKNAAPGDWFAPKCPACVNAIRQPAR